MKNVWLLNELLDWLINNNQSINGFPPCGFEAGSGHLTDPSVHDNISGLLSSGWQRRKASTRCLSTTWPRCSGPPCWGPPRRTARSLQTPPNPSAWGTAGPWKSWHRWFHLPALWHALISYSLLKICVCNVFCFPAGPGVAVLPAAGDDPHPWQ